MLSIPSRSPWGLSNSCFMVYDKDMVFQLRIGKQREATSIKEPVCPQETDRNKGKWANQVIKLWLCQQLRSTAPLTTVAVGQPLESRGGCGPVEMHCSDLCLTVPRQRCDERCDTGRNWPGTSPTHLGRLSKEQSWGGNGYWPTPVWQAWRDRQGYRFSLHDNPSWDHCGLLPYCSDEETVKSSR